MFRVRRCVTRKEISHYNRDGFVKLPGILPADWITKLRSVIDRLHCRGVLSSEDRERREKDALGRGDKVLTDGTGPASGRFCTLTDYWRQDEELRSLCLEQSLPGIATEIFQTDKGNYLIGQIFLKEPGAKKRTPFLCGEAYFNCTGNLCATFWIPVDPVDKANGAMGYVPGSHLWGRTFGRNSFVTGLHDTASSGEPMPDIEKDEEKYGVRYVDSWPGDIIVHHDRTLHGSTANTDPARIRRAAALRYGGADLRCFERMPHAILGSNLRNGDPMDSDEFLSCGSG
jgi:ectoine hydroxylase-related dioxygenase (phytanoyl-CoA dioxygenase family)